MEVVAADSGPQLQSALWEQSTHKQNIDYVAV